MGHRLHNYIWLVIKTAWRHSFHAAHSVILALIIIAGLVTHFVPWIEVMVDLDGWEVATFVFAGVVAVRLFLSPYWIWKDDQNHVGTLMAKMSSLVSITFAEGPPYVYEALGFRCYRFRVKNEANVPAQSCKAEMVSAYSKDRQIISIPFSLRRSFHHDEVFMLRGGEELFIDLLAVPIPGLREGNYPAKIAELGANSWPQFGTGGACMPNEPATFTVQILSDGPPATLNLKYENDGKEWRVRLA